MNIQSIRADGVAPAKTSWTPAEVNETAGGTSILQQYLRIALRWKSIVIGCTLGAIALGLIVTLLMTPKYTANATIEISRESDQVTGFQGVERDVSVADMEFYQTQYGLLRSPTLAERVAADQGLVNNPGFFEMFGAGDRDEPAFKLTNGRYPAQGREVRQRLAGEILLANVGIDPARLSRLVAIRFTAPDPDLAAGVANAWAKNFIDTNLERKVQSTAYGREVLRRQLAEYKDRLDESQRQLVGYASKEQIINLPAGSGGDEDRSIVSDNLATLNTALAQAMAKRIEAQSRLREAGGRGSSAEALTNNAINNLRQRRAELMGQYEQLMVRFEPSYPQAVALSRQIDEIEKAIAQEETRVAGLFRTEYSQALEQENALRARVNALKNDFLDLRRRSIQYNIYQQEVDTNRALYDGLLQRFKEIGVAGGVGVNNISIVDLADVPQRPSSPRIVLNLFLAMLAGLLTGAAIAFARQHLDETIGDPTELPSRLGIPLLGTVPKVTGETPREALVDRKSAVNDAYLAVQTSLAFTTEHGVAKSFAVTSTRASEGKSTTSLALATTLARAGRKVILVDGDMRSPSVHHLGGVGHDRGLSNFLSGDDDIAAMTFQMADLGLTAMSAGPIPPNAAELLTGVRLRALIERLLESFDNVIIDSPPVLGLADAQLIGARVEGVIYAIEARGVRASQVRMALSRLADANVRIFGGVLTKFDHNNASYGYDYDYGYGYGRNEEARVHAQ